MQPSFTPKTLSFLRALKRHNHRDWFRARRDEYERHVRAPMIAVIERLAVDFGRFAPELEASPKRCIYRIYRDTRFSDDKTPLKTQIAASFRWRGLPRGGSAGLYVEVNPGWVWMGGGFYAPESADLARIRRHISDTHPELHRLTRAAAFRRAFDALEGERLSRVPRGFSKDDPAEAYLKHRNFLAGREFGPELATSAELYPTLLATFKAVMPIVRFLNEPLVPEKSVHDSASRQGLYRSAGSSTL
jgi:uncharacterized protein (TIGR02453 family)